MPPRRFRLNPRFPEYPILEEASQVVSEGKLITLPTDTFYALAADGLNEGAVARVLAAKGRKTSQPTGLLMADADMLESVAVAVPEYAARLMDRFWPGPLNLVFKGKDSLPRGVLGERHGVSVRVPASNVAVGIIRILGRPVTATSANKTGGEPPRTASEVIQSLGEHLEIVLDAGETPGGLPSTIVDVRGKKPILLRGGVIDWDEILACLRG